MFAFLSFWVIWCLIGQSEFWIMINLCLDKKGIHLDYLHNLSILSCPHNIYVMCNSISDCFVILVLELASLVMWNVMSNVIYSMIYEHECEPCTFGALIIFCVFSLAECNWLYFLISESECFIFIVSILHCRKMWISCFVIAAAPLRRSIK